MKTIATLLAVAALTLAANAADAKGCLKGAAVGGVAGHYAGHHGVLGAIAGCAYGRHRAKEQAGNSRASKRPVRRPLARTSCKADCSRVLDSSFPGAQLRTGSGFFARAMMCNCTSENDGDHARASQWF